MMRKYIIILSLLVIAGQASAQFPGTDSLRNYNYKYITNNPATAFTNLRLHTLLRGIIDFIDTARAGTGGGGVVGVDTLYALNDSTIRYRRNGVFRNVVLKGVYDNRRKVDTMYTVNDTTIRITINGQVRNIILPGRGGSNTIAKSAQTADGNYIQDWNHKWLYFNNLNSLNFVSDDPDPNHPFNRKIFQLYSDSTIDTYPLRMLWGLKNIDNDFTDSLHFELTSTPNITYLYHYTAEGAKTIELDLNAGAFYPNVAIYPNGNGKNGYYEFGASTAELHPQDSITLKAVPAATADSLLAIRALSNGVNTVIKIPATAVGGSGISGLTSGRVVIATGATTVGDDAGFTYNSATNKLAADSAQHIQVKADSAFLTKLAEYAKPDSTYLLGNSHTVGQGATTTDSAYAYREAAALAAVPVSLAVSGTGATSTANRFLINKNPGNTTAAIAMVGFNEPRRNGLPRKTLNKIINAHKAIFANQYLKSYTAAGGSGVTRFGSWTTSWSAQAEGGKVTNGAYTSTTNDSISYAFTDSTVIVALMPGDGSASSYIGTDVDIRIDGGAILTTINTNDQTDGVADGSGLDNKRCATAFFFTGLTNAAHTITLIKKSTGGGGFLICDYFGHLVDKSQAQLMLWHHIPKMTAAGYATSPANATDATTDTVNAKIDSLKAAYPFSIYPTYVVRTNDVYDPDVDADPDGIHMANAGHRKIADYAINSTLEEAVPTPGRIGAVYYTNEFKGVTDDGKKTFLMREDGDSRYVRNQSLSDQPADFRIDGTGTASRLETSGTILTGSIVDADRQTGGVTAGVASGGPVISIKRPSGTTNARTFDWFVGSNGIQHRVLSDDLLTSIDYLNIATSAGPVIDSIEMPKLNINGTLKVKSHVIASNSDSAVVRDLLTGEYKYAKINGGSGVTGSGTTNYIPYWNGTSSLTGNYTMQRTATSDGEGLEIQNDATGVGAGNGAVFNLYLNNASPSGTDRLGEFHFYGNNSSAAKKQLTAIYAEADGVTAGAENGKQLMNITVAGAIKEYFKAEKSNSNVKLRLANTALINEDDGSAMFGDLTDPVSTFKYEKSVNGAMKSGFVNDNTGSGAYSELLVTESPTLDQNASLRLIKLGSNWSTFGAYKQHGASIETGSDVSGGLSIMSSHTSTGEIRFYTAGIADANRRMSILNGGNVEVVNDLTVADEAYDATAWNGNTEVPTKNAIRDKIESLGGGLSGSGTSGRVAYWNGSSSLTSASNFLFDGNTLTVQSSGAGSGLFSSSNSGTGIVAESTSGEALSAYILPTSTNTLATIARIQRFSSGTAGNGIGGAFDWFTQSSNGSAQRSNRIGSIWTDATTASRTSTLEIYGVNSGSEARKAALAGNGQWTWDGYGAGTHTGTPTGSLQVTSGGGVIEGPVLASGTFTPTLTAVDNTSSPLLDGARYTRIGNIVTFSLRFSVTTSAGSSASSIRVALPVASSFSNINQAAGTCSGLLGRVESDATNDELIVAWTSGAGGTETIVVTGQYTIL